MPASGGDATTVSEAEDAPSISESVAPQPHERGETASTDSPSDESETAEAPTTDAAPDDLTAAPQITTGSTMDESRKFAVEPDTYAIRPLGGPVGIPSGHADAGDFIPEEKRQQFNTAAAVAARLRSETKPRSCFREIVKVVLGGIVGLAIGYWILNYFWGPRFDWLKIYLPGCEHTREHWPAQYLPWESPEPPPKKVEPSKKTGPAAKNQIPEPPASSATPDAEEKEQEEKETPIISTPKFELYGLEPEKADEPEEGEAKAPQ
jgi:hypothetical protein